VKTLQRIVVAVALLALGGCASDPQFDQTVGESLDAATKILEVVIQGVQMFGGQ